jgi:hypothetical protein
LIVARRRLLAWTACAAAGALPASSAPARADGGDVTALLTRIGRARASVTSLEGPFTQTRTIGLLAAEVRSRGTLTLVRPDRLRWELEPPDAVTFWIGPEGMAYRSAHGHGAMAETSARVAAALDDLRTLLGGDVARLRDRWQLHVVRDAADGAEIEATPASSAPPAGLTSLRFALAPDLVRPTRVVLEQGVRDRTQIDFGELRVNAPVDPAKMRPPAG